MNIRNILLVLCFAAGTAWAQDSDNVVDEVIWVVGDEPILKSDVEAVRLEAEQRGQRWDKDPYCSIPEQLAVQKLFLNQAAIDSISVPDADVFQDVDQRLNEVVLEVGSREKLEEYLGKPFSQIREQWYASLRDRKIMEQVQLNLVKSIKVTPVQVRRYFEKLPEDSVPFVPTMVECQIITREPFVPQEEIERVKNELRRYTDQVNSGAAQFSTLALLYSEDKESAQRGGELGFQGRGTYMPEFATAAFNLTDKNTVSKVVETEYGFHIIQLIEKRGDMINCRHILRKPRVTMEALQQCVNDLDSIVKDIEEGVYTFDECVSRVSYDKNTRNNYGLLFDIHSGISKYEMKDLPPEVARAVAGLNVGEISKPFVMTNSRGKEVVAIVKLKTRINGHRATMTDDYQVLQDVMLGKLHEEKLDNWIREKQRSTYVRINEKWRDCEFSYPGWIKENSADGVE